MKKLIILVTTCCLPALIQAQVNISKTVQNIGQTITNSSGNKLSNDEVINGLKEALTVGTSNSTSVASKLDGFNKNPMIKIPFPKEAQQMQTTLVNVGMKKQVDAFVMTLNRAAEEAAKDAAPIFINAIKSMSITDGFTILKGSENEATKYLQDKTTAELAVKFKPVVIAALQKVQITKYWNPLSKKYNKMPMVQKVNPNLEEYVTAKAIEGLFKLVAQEESKIRKDPASRISDILKKVFG